MPQKANLKRVLFQQLKLDINDEDDYESGMDFFRRSLSEEKVKSYRGIFRELNLPVTTTIYYNMNVLNIKVKNNFMLETIEERRIRDRFSKATSFTNLFDFFYGIRRTVRKVRVLVLQWWEFCSINRESTNTLLPFIRAKNTMKQSPSLKYRL